MKTDQPKKNGNGTGIPQYTLCYGMRLDPGTAQEQAHPHISIQLPDGTDGDMALHIINGGMEAIKKQLHESIDAYFEIYEDRQK